MTKPSPRKSSPGTEKNVASPTAGSWIALLKVHRSDLTCAVLLAVFSASLWCWFNNRLTAESWQTPQAYISEPEKGDALAVYTAIRAARDGHLTPLFSRIIPELGAPYDGNWNDFPITSCMVFYTPGVIARFVGIFAASNLAAMMAYVLAAVGFFAACRLCKYSAAWSCAGALIFAFARYPFGHGVQHLDLTYFFYVPLCLAVCKWISEGDGIGLREWRFAFALAVGFLTGTMNPYYTSMFCQFVIFGTLVQFWRQRDWRVALPSVAIIGAAAFGFSLMNLPTFLYHFTHGPNPGAVVRPYMWLEFYGLKIVDLLMPPPDHRFPALAAWGVRHLKEVYISPGELPPCTYLGLAGIVALVWLIVVSVRRVLNNEAEAVPREAWYILWIQLYSEVGGVNGILGTMGFMLFRATTRYTIFILCIVLMFAVGRLSRIKFKQPLYAWLLAAAAVLFALLEQTPPRTTAGQLQEIQKQVASDRSFTETIERRLPPKSMVFQIPVMEFPEVPVQGVGGSDHFRPYFYSKQLRFSFGSDKGRPREKWQQGITAMPFADAVDVLESYGFSALYVNRNGFSDKGESLLKTLRETGHDDIIESDQHDLFCVILKPSKYPVLLKAP